MAVSAQVKPSSPTSPLSGAEKVAVLLLALGKARAGKLLKRFDGEEIKMLTRSASELSSVSAPALENIVEEFAQNFSNGLNFVGSVAEVKALLAAVMSEDQGAGVIADANEGAGEPAWKTAARIKVDVLRAFLLKEHPQAIALILTKIDSELAAKLVSSFPADFRIGVLSRMLSIKRVSNEALKVVESIMREELKESGSTASHTGIADILNRLDRTQSEEVLKSLAETRPNDAKALKSLLFTFEELAGLSQKARTLLLDQVPIERLVLALNGTDTTFQATILSSLASRSRRMVEAELQAGSSATPKDIADARRSIVDAVLKMMAKGEIEIAASESAGDGPSAQPTEA